MNEIPVCAAIRLQNGLQIAGKRHHDCLAQIHEAGQLRMHSVQGFMTNHGRFVDRVRAKFLHKKAGLLILDADRYNRSDELFSEDLY